VGNFQPQDKSVVGVTEIPSPTGRQKAKIARVGSVEKSLQIPWLPHQSIWVVDGQSVDVAGLDGLDEGIPTRTLSAFAPRTQGVVPEHSGVLNPLTAEQRGAVILLTPHTEHVAFHVA
jgi:hypothetical protein